MLRDPQARSFRAEKLTILRYDTPAAVLVPAGWHREALAAMDRESNA